jgi:hypothetical protein
MLKERVAVAMVGLAFAQLLPADTSGPLSITIQRYVESADSGANFKVFNSTSTEFKGCSIQLGDGEEKQRWFLPKPTVLDANGLRSYPSFMFRDRQGLTPPTATTIRYALIECTSPRLRQEFEIK